MGGSSRCTPGCIALAFLCSILATIFVIFIQLKYENGNIEKILINIKNATNTDVVWQNETFIKKQSDLRRKMIADIGEEEYHLLLNCLKVRLFFLINITFINAEIKKMY